MKEQFWQATSILNMKPKLKVGKFLPNRKSWEIPSKISKNIL